jgi:hypothetical protein
MQLTYQTPQVDYDSQYAIGNMELWIQKHHGKQSHQNCGKKIVLTCREEFRLEDLTNKWLCHP